MPAQTWPNPATITRPRRQTPVYQSHRFRGRHDTAHSGADRAFWAPAARVYSANSPGFNPHPPLRADAIAGRSIATKCQKCFNPHPPLRADAMPRWCLAISAAEAFQSSPALTGGCYKRWSHSMRRLWRCFNPHPPLRADAIALSILRLSGGVVSILTRPYGRMLFGSDVTASGAQWFQSSPALTGGCYDRISADRTTDIPFQSSPALTGGCYSGCAASAPCPACFNPHPPLRADAMPVPRLRFHRGTGFNPHPPLRADAMCPIWTEVQWTRFQSSPALTGGCYDRISADRTTDIPFQSSPALTGGCYLTWG